MSKRKRSANWLIQEKLLLLDLITDHITIVENKKTDGVTVKQKNAEWVKIYDEFNSQTTGIHRTVKNIKLQWESLKKNTRKVASSARQSLLQTGGEPAKPQVNDPIHSKIMGLLSTSTVGLCNNFDSDNAVIIISEGTSENYPSQGEPALAKVSVPDLPNILQPKSTISSSDVLPGITVESENIEPMPMISQDWGDYTIKTLKTPVSSSHQFYNKETSVSPIPDEVTVDKILKLKAKPWVSKCRPKLPATCSSTMEELQKMKIKALEMQMNFAVAEREEAKKMFEINYETQKEILIQQKLKTRLLRIEIFNSKRQKKENND